MDEFNVSKIMGKIDSVNLNAQNETVLDVLNFVVAKSPVKDGFYRANHIVTYKNPTNRVRSTPDKSGAKTISQGVDAIGRIKAFGDVIYVQNNLPYAMPLEFGHSGQAENGIYRLALQAVTK